MGTFILAIVVYSTVILLLLGLVAVFGRANDDMINRRRTRRHVPAGFKAHHTGGADLPALLQRDPPLLN